MILIITEARGISIGSCLAKLYSTVLYLRILEVNENFQLINNKQIGFLKRFTTADHFLVLDTIINEVVHKHRQKLFVVFVDLKKAYDKIDRQALIIIFNPIRPPGGGGGGSEARMAKLTAANQKPLIQ